jgi:hypothetical protein
MTGIEPGLQFDQTPLFFIYLTTISVTLYFTQNLFEKKNNPMIQFKDYLFTELLLRNKVFSFTKECEILYVRSKDYCFILLRKRITIPFIEINEKIANASY